MRFFAKQGEIRLDRPRAENEVILVVPTIHKETASNGDILYSYPTPEKTTKENTWREAKFRVDGELGAVTPESGEADEIRISQPVPGTKTSWPRG